LSKRSCSLGSRPFGKLRARVEAGLAALEEQLEVVPGDAVVFAQNPLGLVPEVLDPVDVFAMLVYELAVMVNAFMFELAHLQHIIALEAVGVHNRVRHNFLSDDWHQPPGLEVVGNHRVHCHCRF